MHVLQTGVCNALDNHSIAASVPGEGSASGLQQDLLWLSAAAISQMLKGALTLEVECTEMTETLIAELVRQRWRQKVDSALKSLPKPAGEQRSESALTLY